MQILHVQIGVILFRASVKELRVSFDLIEDGDLFQVVTALKSNVSTQKVPL